VIHRPVVRSCNFAHSALASFRIGISGSAFFQKSFRVNGLNSAIHPGGRAAIQLGLVDIDSFVVLGGGSDGYRIGDARPDARPSPVVRAGGSSERSYASSQNAPTLRGEPPVIRALGREMSRTVDRYRQRDSRFHWV
jgi:hypothetical protein